MAQSIVPVVGSSGFYRFAAPFDLASVNQIEYSCKAVRKISDYLANNEEIKKDVYEAYELPDDIWEEDSALDAYIVSLQSTTGHWLYIPSRYILGYPSVNGVPYRTLMIGVSLPSIPVAQDLSSVMADMKDLVETSLGLSVVVKQVETSKVVLIPYDDHVVKQQQRAVQSAGKTTQHARNVALRRENDALLAKVAELEAFIKKNHS